MKRRGAWSLLLLLALAVWLLATPASAQRPPFRFGATDAGMGSPLYANTIPRYFNSISPEAIFKFEFIHPCPPAWLLDPMRFPDTFNFSVYEWVVRHGTAHPNPAYHCFSANADAHEWEWGTADNRIAFAEANGMMLFAHSLLWHVSNPAWLTDPDVALSPAERERLMEEHLRGAVRHLAASPAVTGFDVVNEAIAPDGTLLPLSPWVAVPDYIHKAFTIARDELTRMGRSDVRLFYNDYEIEYGYARHFDLFVNPPGCYRKSDAVFRYLKTLIERGTPIDGIGFQTHLVVTGEAVTPCGNERVDVSRHDTGRLTGMMRRFGALGLEVLISEVDVARRGSGLLNAELEALQARYFAGVLEACLSLPEICTGYTVWGTHDGGSWYVGRADFPSPRPLLFEAADARVFDPDAGRCVPVPAAVSNEEYCPKAAYHAVSALLNKAQFQPQPP